MGKCSWHPEVETSYLCMKDNVHLCADCLTCRHPNIYRPGSLPGQRDLGETWYTVRFVVART